MIDTRIETYQAVSILESMDTPTYTLTEAARLIGVAPITLKRWLLGGKVPEVPRDRNGWRVFREQDVIRIKRYADHVTPPKDK